MTVPLLPTSIELDGPGPWEADAVVPLPHGEDPQPLFGVSAPGCCQWNPPVRDVVCAKTVWMPSGCGLLVFNVSTPAPLSVVLSLRSGIGCAVAEEVTVGLLIAPRTVHNMISITGRHRPHWQLWGSYLAEVALPTPPLISVALFLPRPEAGARYAFDWDNAATLLFPQPPPLTILPP